MRILNSSHHAKTICASALLVAMGIGAGNFPTGYSQTREAGEYEIKAAFLYNFARFVEWPQPPSSDARPPIIIAIVGDDPFGDTLNQMIQGKSINGRALVVRRVKKVEEAKGCQIAFISSSERPRLRSIIDSLDGAGVLTVGDMEGFAQLGGVINFKMEDNKVRFEINLDAADRAGLKISSKLLSLAKIVKGQDRGRKG